MNKNNNQLPKKNYSRRQLQLIEANNLIRKLKANGSLNGLNIEPRNLHFATQDRDEKIYIYIRRHWIENIRWILTNFVYILIPIIIAILANLLNISFGFLSLSEYTILLISYYSIIFTNSLKNFFNWYFDPYIITNQRVVHYEFKPFSNYEVKETSLTSIENVSEASYGFIAGILIMGL